MSEEKPGAGTGASISGMVLEDMGMAQAEGPEVWDWGQAEGAWLR